MTPTSGKLVYSEVKGLHRLEIWWWVDTGIRDSAFLILGPDNQPIAEMRNDGRMQVSKGYLWDGSSGPTVDGAADPVPSLVHDVLYEAMRTEQLPTSMRSTADSLYYQLLRERGMSWLRAGARYWGLRLFASGAASPKRGGEYPRRAAA